MTIEEQYKDFVGKRFNHMTILAIEPYRVDGKVMVKCRCDCGNEKVVRLRHLQENMTKSCGLCDFRAKAIHDRCALDLTGQRVGKLVALRPTTERNGSFVVWECVCDCGRHTFVNTNRFKSGRKKSCGQCGYKAEQTRAWCKKYFTDDEKSLGLVVFNDMRSRCYNKNDPAYPIYGGRGIYICDEWMKDRTKFVRWAIEHGYKKGLTVDRYPDRDGPYAPWNCRVATNKAQQNNRRNNHLITVDGITHTCSEWAEMYEVYPDRFYRLSDEDIIRSIKMLDKGKKELGELYDKFKNDRVLASSCYRRYFGDPTRIIANDRGNKMLEVGDINQSCTRWDVYFHLPDGYTQQYYKDNGKDATEAMIAKKLSGM